MSKPYDAASKDLLEADPAGWAALLGVVRPAGRVRLIDSDLSTVTAAADKIIRIEDEQPWLLHVEFQSGPRPSLPRRMLQYNALLHARHELPVASVLVLLVPDANSPQFTGRYALSPPFGAPWEFPYTVVRVWELPAERLLQGPISLLPLAVIANTPIAAVPDILRQIENRVKSEADAADGERLVTSIGILLQLRYGAMTAEELLQKMPYIRDYEVFQVFKKEGLAEGRAEGRAEGMRQTILDLGRKKFGPPSSDAERTMKGITDLARLKALSERLLDVNSWDELLRE